MKPRIFVPHGYQQKAIATAWRTKHLALFLDPGLGKTVIMLWLYHILRRTGKVKKPMLVVAPLRPCFTVWPKEVKKWAFSKDMVVRVLHGANKVDEFHKPADIYVINPEGLKWLLQDQLKGVRNWPYDILVVDESGKFKNPTSKRLKTMKNRLKRFSRRYILNGTPAPNGVMDLWSQFMIVDEGKQFGRNITHYRNQFFHKSGYYGHEYKINNEEARDTIYRRASHMALVMRSSDYLNLPPITFNDITVTLPRKAMEYYLDIETELFTVIDEDELEIKNAAVASGACRQVASGGLYHPTPEGATTLPSKSRPWYDIHRAKDEAMIDLIEELQGKPLLIAYEFHHDLVRIKEAIKKAFKLKVPHIGSGVSTMQGAKIEADWNAGKLRVLLGQPASMSHGLNMQKSTCEDILWYTPPWSLEAYIQYYQRVWRQGMKGEVMRVHHIVAENTIDEIVVARLGEKNEIQDDLKTALIKYRMQKLHK